MGAIYFHSNHGGGRPRGTPLRGLGKIRKWEGRCGQGEGGRGPRMRTGGGDGFPSAILAREGSPREQREGRGVHCGMTGDTGTGGSRTAPTGEGAGAWGQSIFIAITGEGAHEGRPYGGWGRFVSGRADVGRAGEGWVPACARTTGGTGGSRTARTGC